MTQKENDSLLSCVLDGIRKDVEEKQKFLDAAETISPDDLKMIVFGLDHSGDNWSKWMVRSVCLLNDLHQEDIQGEVVVSNNALTATHVLEDKNDGSITYTGEAIVKARVSLEVDITEALKLKRETQEEKYVTGCKEQESLLLSVNSPYTLGIPDWRLIKAVGPK